MSTETLLERTVALLHTRKGSFRVIAAETGLDYHWLHKLSQGAIADPGVNKIERLNQYLRSTPN